MPPSSCPGSLPALCAWPHPLSCPHLYSNPFCPSYPSTQPHPIMPKTQAHLMSHSLTLILMAPPAHFSSTGP